MSFNFEEEKKATIARLDALERIGLDYKQLKEQIINLDVNALIAGHIKAEVEKIQKFAKKHNIDFKVDIDELALNPVNYTILPFKLSGHRQLDIHGESWIYNEYAKRWEMEEVEDWTDSWSSSDQSC